MNKKAIFFGGFCILLSIGVLLFVFLPRNRSQTITPPPILDPDVLLTVGEEKIYKADLTTEMSFAPNTSIAQSEETHKNKLIRDSIILQAGAREKRIELDSSFFNNMNKDYDKRIEMIRQVEESVRSDQDRLEGSIVSIWFFNNDYLGPLGYEGGKVSAFEKLQTLHDEVKAGTLTMEEAGERIASDTTIETLDPAYKVNAIYSFSTSPNAPITFDEDFNQALKKLAVGEVSEIYTLKDTNDNTREGVEAVHSFGQVTKRVGNGVSTFEDWIKNHESEFQVVYNNK